MFELFLTLFCCFELALSDKSSKSPQKSQKSSGRTSPCEAIWNPYMYLPGKCHRLIPERANQIGDIDIGISQFRYGCQKNEENLEQDRDEPFDLALTGIQKELEDIF